MREDVGWWNTRAGQVVLTLVFIAIAMGVVPRITDRIPIPTDSVAWAIVPWVFVVFFWIVLGRQMRARYRNERGND
jgi:hypothetical protein